MQSDRIFVVIPTLNEAAHLDGVLHDLRADGLDAPVLILDGGSRDATRAIAARWARDWPRVSLRDNPARGQAAAVNMAAQLARAAGAQVLVRLDAHARYPAGYVQGVADSLRRTGADSVVVPLIAQAGDPGPWAQASARLQCGWLGHGGAAHRRQDKSGGWVPHGHHAAFRLDRFLAVGGYDTGFAANEDAEFDLRLTAAGGRIWLEPRWPVAYYPRAAPRALWRQMHRNGYWRVRNAHKHHMPLGLRQRLPIAPCLAPALALMAPWLGWPLLLPLLLYGALLGAVSLVGVRPHAPLQGLRMALLAVAAHLGFGSGVLRGLAGLPPPGHGAANFPPRARLRPS